MADVGAEEGFRERAAALPTVVEGGRRFLYGGDAGDGEGA